ncbi:MAG: phosphoglycerate kinase [Bacilli bacterium]|nr:phosphoglycerate kinase [Bacilli bacterium]
MKKTIKDYDLKGKKVIIRCDLNVPIKDGIIVDDNRIRESLKTIKTVIRRKGKVIILSHLGRVKTEEDKKKYTLRPVAERLSTLLKKNVTFVDATRGEKVEEAINKMKNRDIVMLENTRFEDLKGEKESKNNPTLARYWASLGDIFVNDAFGTIHRKHASNVGIAKRLPNAIGYLVRKEITILSEVLDNPKRPYVVILGGSKVSDKIEVIDNLVCKADYVLIGGAMAFTFLKASGFKVGKSLVEKEYTDYCKGLLETYENKIVLPIDVMVGTSISEKEKGKKRFINEIKEDEMGLDIGPGTVKVFKQYLDDAGLIFWNGPIGYFENKNFSLGTKSLLEIISKTKAKTILGGGDTASAAINMGYQGKITHISTGGGASLEFLEGKELPGFKVINEKE